MSKQRNFRVWKTYNSWRESLCFKKCLAQLSYRWIIFCSEW